VTTNTEQNAAQPKKGSGRRSCLLALAVLFAVAVVLAGAGFGVVYLASGGLAFGRSVAVVEVKGAIFESDGVVRSLVRHRRSERVKAIVLRIDSPGGAVAPCQEIYREIRRTAETKPVVASMGAVAASGGLYIASPATRVVANRATVTGSIGAIMQSMNFRELLGKVGLEPVIIKSGRFKDAGSPVTEMSEADRRLLQNVVDELHEQFVSDLAESRGLDIEAVRAVADGRVFTGEEAEGLGLVDQIGSFRDALETAKRLAGISGRIKVIYPEKERSLLQALIGSRAPLDGWASWPEKPFRFMYLYLPM
jgi:protease-4